MPGPQAKKSLRDLFHVTLNGLTGHTRDVRLAEVQQAFSLTLMRHIARQLRVRDRVLDAIPMVVE